MDRNDRQGGMQHDLGQSGMKQDMGQAGMMQRSQGGRFGERHYGSEQDSSREWGFIVTGAVMAAIGGYLLYQGARGRPANVPFLSARHDESAGAMGMGRGERMQGRMRSRQDSGGVQVREQITINRPVSELYRFWRNVENLPRVMGYLEEVTSHGDRRSHWVAKGPAGQKIEWDAEVTDARENELLAWRSLEGSEVPNEGSVRFSRSADGQGTVIDVALTYHPPGGKAGAAIARLLGREPAQEIRQDLERFKERVESGNMILTSGASSAGGTTYGGGNT